MSTEKTIESWEGIPVKLECVNIDSYKLILNQAEKRFLAILDQSRDLTTKSWNLLKINTLAISTFIPFSVEDFNCFKVFCFIIVIVLYITSCILSFRLIKSKEAYEIGSIPSEIYLDYLEEQENNIEEREMDLHRTIIFQYYHSIKEMGIKNENRVSLFDLNLILTLLISIICVGKVIYHFLP